MMGKSAHTGGHSVYDAIVGYESVKQGTGFGYPSPGVFVQVDG
jgi:hypothetical protein